MNDIRKEFHKLSKQGKINAYYYFILAFLSLILIKTQEKQIEELQVKTIIIEQRQKNLFNSYGG